MGLGAPKQGMEIPYYSNVREITPKEVILQENEKILHCLPNDCAIVFAGGDCPLSS